MEPTLTLITVCYQAAEEIERTIQSVLEQRFTDYEYIFIDGGSRDGTVERIWEFRELLLSRCRGVHVTSEPDGGIYDAMNKGLDQAEGRWVLMLNAGDALADPWVLEDFFQGREWEEDVLYGDAVLRDVYRSREVFRPFPAMELDRMAQGLPFCHQAAFAKRELLQKYRFDTRFTITADYDLFLRAWLAGVRFRHYPRVTAIFDGSGLCLRRPHVTMAQCAQVRKLRGFLGQSPSLGQKLRARAREGVRKNLPGLFYSHRRGWRDRLARDGTGRVRRDG